MTDHQHALSAIKALHARLAAGRQDYDFQPPALASHAQDYATQPERLKRYAQQVINARIMVLLASSTMTTQALLQTYLLGEQNKVAFPLLLATRAQLELYAMVADAVRVTRECALQQDKDFAQRVHAVDLALINATYGTRSAVVKETMAHLGVSRLRPTKDEDLDNLTSKNVLTRLEKLARSKAYSECKQDYERLCEYVHPNWGMNMLHLVASPINAKFLRLSLTSPDPFERALLASASAMYRSASGTLSAFDGLEPPFGSGEMVFLR
jgi:hypothetical protein